MQIILDMSGGNTCRNDKTIVKQMIDAIKDIDTGKHEIFLKWQLSLPDGINVPLDHDVFDYAYKYGNEQGYKTTSSVADLESLKFLLQYEVPFVKIPNCRELDWLIGYVPRMIQVYVSVCDAELFYDGIPSYCNSKKLACISQYPATIKDYEYHFEFISNGFKQDKLLSGSNGKEFRMGISDHTIGLDLFKKYKPMIWEKHFKLPDSTGPDAGEFAITPKELKEIL
jgi:sialic acid synthase SpsE